MLALADWSDDNGKCYPSMSAIAKKIRLSKSQTQRVVHGLIDDGYLKVTANALGGSPTQTRNYRIVLDRLTGSAHATGRVDAAEGSHPCGGRGSAHATGRVDAAEGSHPCGGRGSAHATQTVSEPSTNRQHTDGAKKPRRVSSPSAPNDEPGGFAECWAAYPKRHGQNNRSQALKAYQARIKAGVSHADILAGVKRYAVYCQSEGITATKYVKHAATFFGPDHHFADTWSAAPDAAANDLGTPDFMAAAMRTNKEAAHVD